MDDIRWFAPNQYGNLPVEPLRAQGVSIATEGDGPARTVFIASPAMAKVGYLYAWRHRARFILNIWDVPLWWVGRGHPDHIIPWRGHLLPIRRLSNRFSGRQRYYGRLLHIARRAAAVWTPSRHTCDEVRRVFGLPAERVPFCFDAERFNRSVGWKPPPHPLILSVSRLVDYKNHVAVLRAAALLPSRPAVRFIGRGPEAPRLRALAAELGITLQLDEAYVSTDEIVEAYRHASVVVCPSRFEGIGITPLEAAAVGVPTIASDIPTHREFATGEMTLVPLDDDVAMAAAIEEALRVDRAMPSEPKHPFPELTIEACAARMLPRIEQLLRTS